MKSLCAQTDQQRVYYSQGVATLRGESIRGGVTGYGIDAEIINAYVWLVGNFIDGDEIFIFGFSRGTYTARSLSGLILKCGVLKLGAPLSIEQLYARYRLYTAATIRALLSAALPADASLEDRWLVKYSQPTPVKFIGVWDTVGSLGLPLGRRLANIARYRFLDTHLRLDNQNAWLDYKGSVLNLTFTLPLKKPIKAKELKIEVYDPSIFVDFEWAKDDPVAL